MTWWMWILFIIILLWCISRTITAAKILADNIEAHNKKKKTVEGKIKEDSEVEIEPDQDIINNHEEWMRYIKTLKEKKKYPERRWHLRRPKWKCPSELVDIVEDLENY